MRTKLVPIGNSKGIRLPKSVLEQCGLRDEIEMEVKSDHLVIRAPSRPRANWDAAFAKMRERGDDALLDPGPAHTLAGRDEKEWTW